jgi:peroxiredoxin
MLFRVFETGSLIALAVGFLSAVGQQPTNIGTAGLKVGDTAPDFSLKDQNNKPVKLADFRGKSNVVLAFFPLAFTGG